MLRRQLADLRGRAEVDAELGVNLVAEATGNDAGARRLRLGREHERLRSGSPPDAATIDHARSLRAR